MYIALLLGTSFWVVDAVYDHLFFYHTHGTFLSLLLTDIPSHEIYTGIRVLFLSAFSGMIIAFYLNSRKESETRLETSLTTLFPSALLTMILP